MKTRTSIARQKMWLIFFVLLLMVGISLLLVRPVGVLITNMQHERAIEEYIEDVDKKKRNIHICCVCRRRM